MIMDKENIPDREYRFYGYNTSVKPFNYSSVIEDYVHYYNKKGVFYKRMYQFLTIFRIVLMACIPILALSESRIWNPYMLTIISSLALVADGISNAFSARDKWKSYRKTCNRLCLEHRMYLAGIDSYEMPEVRDKVFASRCEQILSEEAAIWEKYTDKKVEKE